MKRAVKYLAATLSIATLFFQIGTTSYAYDFENYEYTDDGFIIVKKYNNDAESNAAVYMYTDTSNRDIKNIENHYTFKCTGGAVVEGWAHTPLMFRFNPMDAIVYDTLEGGEIWTWTFALENGEYEFSSPSGSGSYGSLPSMYTLESDMDFPEYPKKNGKVDYMAGGEKITLKDSSVRLYVMYGDKQWREGHLDEFRKWAKETELGFRASENQSLIASANSSEVITIGNKEEINLDELLTEIEKEIELATLEETLHTVSAGDVPATPAPLPASEPVEEEPSSIADVLKSLGAVAVFVILGFVITKKE